MLTVTVTIDKECVDKAEAAAFAELVRSKLESDPSARVSALMTDTLEEES